MAKKDQRSGSIPLYSKLFLMLSATSQKAHRDELLG